MPGALRRAVEAQLPSPGRADLSMRAATVCRLARLIHGLASASTPATTGGPEHIVDLVWTPDGSRLVAITRQTGSPARARVVVLNVPAPEVSDDQPAPSELVLLPAAVQPGSAMPDPGGRWLALVTVAA